MAVTQTAWSPAAAKNTIASAPNRSQYGYAVLLALITAAAAVLRFHALGDRGLWLDEILSANISRESLRQLMQTLRVREINMALYYVLLHFWTKLGDSDSFLRAMSVLFSVATVPFLYAIGARLFGRNVGLLAALLLAVNAFHVHYAQEARAYALFTLLAVIATYLLVRNVQEPSASVSRLYGIVLALMLYSHVLGLLIVAAHAVAIAFLPRSAIPRENLIRSSIWLVVLSIPLVVIVPLIKANPLDWVPRLDSAMVLNFLILTAGNRGTLLLLLEAIAISSIIFQTARFFVRDGRSKENWGSVLVLSWFFVPVVILLAVSAFRPLFVPRFLLPCLPGFLIAVSVGLSRMRPIYIGWTLGGAVSLLCLAGIAPVYHLGGMIDDWRAISADVFSQALPGDEISFSPEYSSTAFEYYRARQTPVPEWPAIVVPRADNACVSSVSPAMPPCRLQNAPAATRRIWIVIYAPAGLTLEKRSRIRTSLQTWKSEGWSLDQAREFADVAVLLLVASSADAVPSDELRASENQDASLVASGTSQASRHSGQ